MTSDDDGIIEGLIEHLGMRRILLVLKALDEIVHTTGYGCISIEIRDRRVEFISKNISEDTRNL